MTSPARAASLVILGADALLAVRPASPAQLVRACRALGYDDVVPASLGDELLARAALARLDGDAPVPAILCSCPRVAHRVLHAGADLAPFLVSLVSPPVALARWLRATHAPTPLRLTYVGRCPGAADDRIDARLTPEELLAVLDDRGVALHDARDAHTAEDAHVDPAWQRYWSEPGGAPTADLLAQRGRALVSLGPDGDLALVVSDAIVSASDALIDPACAVGCACAGAVAGASEDGRRSADEVRARVTELEPPRAHAPTAEDESPSVDFGLPLPASARDALDVVALVPRRTAHAAHAAQPTSTPLDAGRRERTPGAVSARTVVHATKPVARSVEGKSLPRAYVARRRPHGRDAEHAAAPGLTTFDRRHVPADVPRPVADVPTTVGAAAHGPTSASPSLLPMATSASSMRAELPAPVPPPVLVGGVHLTPADAPRAVLSDGTTIPMPSRTPPRSMAAIPATPVAPVPTIDVAEVAARIAVSREPVPRSATFAPAAPAPRPISPPVVTHDGPAPGSRAVPLPLWAVMAAAALLAVASAVGTWVVMR